MPAIPTASIVRSRSFTNKVGGYGHLAVIGHSEFMPHAESEKGMRLFAKYVLPRLREIKPVAADPAGPHQPERARATLARDIENDPVGSFELALEIRFLLVLAEIEEKSAARRLDPLLGRGDVIDLKTEMMGADEIAGVSSWGCRAALALIIGGARD